MDLFVFAVAVGAGYLAKHWQNLSRGTDSLKETFFLGSDSKKPRSPSSIQKLHDKKDPFHRLPIGGRKIPDEKTTEGASVAEVASTSGFDGEKLLNLEDYGNYNVLSASHLPLDPSLNDNLQKIENDIKPGGNIGNIAGNLSADPSIVEMGSSHGSLRNRSSLRSKCSHLHFARPLSSMEICLLAQLYKEHTEMKEVFFSSLPSPSAQIVRPLIVTDGNQIISRVGGDSFVAQNVTDENNALKEAYFGENDALVGIPRLPKILSMDPGNMKLHTGKGPSGRFSASKKVVNGKHYHYRDSPDGMLLLCLGISIGVISSIMANQREVDKLRHLLNQAENLVEDLQEELEMKDTITVKELVNEDHEQQDSCDTCFHEREQNALCLAQNCDKLTEYDNEELYEEKGEKNSENMSKIEAELEAELERLELSMSASGLERRLSDVELYPDIVADVVHGELRADLIAGGDHAQSEPDQYTSSTSTTHTANYSVSPRQLSLRLHEVIQSRLEERVRELEAALENSQRKVQVLEFDSVNSWRESSDSELGSSSTLGSPIPIQEEYHPTIQPFVISLSGEALHAYNEAREELAKVNYLEEEEKAENVSFTCPQQIDQNLCGQCGSVNGSMLHNTISKDISLEERAPLDWGADEMGTSAYQSDGGDEESQMQLIRQIVEKTKQGSPAVLNAQRALFFLNENEYLHE